MHEVSTQRTLYVFYFTEFHHIIYDLMCTYNITDNHLVNILVTQLVNYD